MKELLKDVQTRLKMSDEEFDMYLPDAEHTTKILKEEKIEFLPDFKLVFYAHMISLAKRLKEDIALDCGDDCPEDEVEREAPIMMTPLASRSFGFFCKIFVASSTFLM